MDKESMLYRCGYVDASAHVNVARQTPEAIIDWIDNKKYVALKLGKSYTNGVAQGTWDKLLARQVDVP